MRNLLIGLVIGLTGLPALANSDDKECIYSNPDKKTNWSMSTVDYDDSIRVLSLILVDDDRQVNGIRVTEGRVPGRPVDLVRIKDYQFDTDDHELTQLDFIIDTEVVKKLSSPAKVLLLFPAGSATTELSKEFIDCSRALTR